ncbi:MAG TPA: hypothetical protein VGQ61_01730 [Candidatus Angelobacter sp.]|nr:hypothetical protein [Candidatus Angelobacter sp.]
MKKNCRNRAGSPDRREADHAPSPLFQEQNKFKSKEIISGVERSDKNDGADDRT